jgi:hypothetical protein
MRNKILTAIALATTVAAGAFAGYKIATDDVVCFVVRKISLIRPRRKWML